MQYLVSDLAAWTCPVVMPRPFPLHIVCKVIKMHRGVSFLNLAFFV